MPSGGVSQNCQVLRSDAIYLTEAVDACDNVFEASRPAAARVAGALAPASVLGPVTDAFTADGSSEIAPTPNRISVGYRQMPLGKPLTSPSPRLIEPSMRTLASPSNVDKPRLTHINPPTD